MELSRLLTHDSDASDDGAATSDHCPSDQAQSARPARSQELSVRPPRRRSKLERLRDQVKVLEWFASNARTLHNDDDNDVPLNTDDARMRRFLIRSSRLKKEAAQQRSIRIALAEQLRLLQESSSSIRKLMRGVELSGWFWRCERWRAIAADCYKPFTQDECNRLVEDTLYSIETYKMPNEIDNGAKPSVFGWRDTRGLGKDQLTVHYQSQKTICGSHNSMDDVAAICWSVFQDADLFREMMVSHHSHVHLQVLQHIAADRSHRAVRDVFIVQLVEDHPELPTKIHSINVAVFVKANTGYSIAFRSIESPDLQRAMRSEGMSESSLFFWNSWDASAQDEKIAGECTDFLARAKGVLTCPEPAYARKWILEGILAYVRLEAKLYGTKPLIMLPLP